MKLTDKLILRITAVVALIGLIDTLYLTANHLWGSGVQCVLLEGCEIVLSSKYSMIFQIPLALFGVIFYGIIFSLANIFDIYRNQISLKLLVVAGVAGFSVSLVLLYIQIFILQALCIYCLTSAISSTVIFVASVLLYKNNKGIAL